MQLRARALDWALIASAAAPCVILVMIG
jgi:hypothetical protein